MSYRHGCRLGLRVVRLGGARQLPSTGQARQIGTLGQYPLSEKLYISPTWLSRRPLAHARLWQKLSNLWRLKAKGQSRRVTNFAWLHFMSYMTRNPQLLDPTKLGLGLPNDPKLPNCLSKALTPLDEAALHP